jgi:hypothetical protein
VYTPAGAAWAPMDLWISGLEKTFHWVWTLLPGPLPAYSGLFLAMPVLELLASAWDCVPSGTFRAQAPAWVLSTSGPHVHSCTPGIVLTPLGHLGTQRLRL